FVGWCRSGGGAAARRDKERPAAGPEREWRRVDDHGAWLSLSYFPLVHAKGGMERYRRSVEDEVGCVWSRRRGRGCPWRWRGRYLLLAKEGDGTGGCPCDGPPVGVDTENRWRSWI
ncbi:unnamed protein product, partial [Hapterophycus canaliculatus]